MSSESHQPYSTHPSVSFSRTNPPPTENDALRKLELLGGDISRVTVQLDHADASTFSSEREYLAWRRRAMDALAHMQREEEFLNSWIDARQRAAASFVEQQGTRNNYTRLQTKAQEIRKRARELASKIITDGYAVRYTTSFLPENLDNAHERSQYLVRIKQEIVAAFAEISSAWTSDALRRNDLPGVKAPLTKILLELEVELGIVRGFIRTASVSNVGPWKTVCYYALARAVTEGFVLTAEEQNVFDQLKSLR